MIASAPRRKRPLIATGLWLALLVQLGLAAALLWSDGQMRWTPRIGVTEPLPTGPVAPGDQTRRYDPARPAPDFTTPGDRPSVDLPDNVPPRLEFRLTEVEGLGSVLLLNGAIDNGDADRLSAFLSSQTAPPERVALNSPGGIVDEALAIGRILRAEEVDTHMLPGMICLSSCPYVFASGTEREVSDRAAVGMHQHYYEAPGLLPVFLAVEGIQHGQGRTMDYLIEMGIDPGLMLYSLNTPPNEIYILVEEELLETRLATSVTD